MANLIIDQGNTVAKIAIFEGEKLIRVILCDDLNVGYLSNIFESLSVCNSLFSGVKNPDPKVIRFLKKESNCFIHLDYTTPLPVRNEYRTPETLGMDRMAAAIGAYNIKPGLPLLVIDMGTAITCDFINKGIYWGGNISPGLTMRFQSLNQYTAKLPLMDQTGEILMLGVNTETAIRSGVVNGIIYELEGIISDMKRKYADLFVFLTGGDAIFFETKLKSVIFADNFLVLKGLNRIKTLLYFNIIV